MSITYMYPFLHPTENYPLYISLREGMTYKLGVPLYSENFIDARPELLHLAGLEIKKLQGIIKQF